MKRLLLFLSLCFVCSAAIAHTINWYVDGSIYHTTTCESGDDVTPPTAPEKYGYTFKGWEGYTPIEYLESTGTQWIDTGIVANEKTEAEIQFKDYTGWFFFASANSYSSKNFGLITSTGTQGQFYFYMNCDGRVPVTTNTANIKLLLTGFFINDTPIEITRGNIPSSTMFTTKYPIYLFGANFSGALNGAGKGKIYFFKLWQDGILIRDFIPVLDKDGVPCMYDLVEHKFYYNAGTGDFVAGPIIGE